VEVVVVAAAGVVTTASSRVDVVVVVLVGDEQEVRSDPRRVRAGRRMISFFMMVKWFLIEIGKAALVSRMPAEVFRR
jgi:hypothetical protein